MRTSSSQNRPYWRYTSWLLINVEPAAENESGETYPLSISASIPVPAAETYSETGEIDNIYTASYRSKNGEFLILEYYPDGTVNTSAHPRRKTSDKMYEFAGKEEKTYVTVRIMRGKPAFSRSVEGRLFWQQGFCGGREVRRISWKFPPDGRFPPAPAHRPVCGRTERPPGGQDRLRSR